MYSRHTARFALEISERTKVCSLFFSAGCSMWISNSDCHVVMRQLVPVCVTPPSGHGHTSQKHKAHRSTSMQRCMHVYSGKHECASNKYTHVNNLVWPQPYAHIVNRRIPWACGTSSHKFHPKTLVSDWLVHRARGEREARPEVERSLKSAGLTSFTNTSTTGGQGSQETGSLLSLMFCLSSPNCWLLSEESRPHLLHPLPAKWLKSGLSGCFKQAEACCREGNANKRHGC